MAKRSAIGVSMSQAAWVAVSRNARIFAMDELRQRFADGVLGAFWVLLAPLLQLAVFYFVFVELFRSRAAETGNYLVFLAIGFWPWMAFSETVLRGTALFVEKAGLTQKVRVSKIGMFMGVTLASFLLHAVGFLMVLSVLLFSAEISVSIQWLLLPLIWLVLYVFAVSVGLFFSVVNVFVRDTAKVVGLVMTLWFFVTPIFYPVSALPSIALQLQAYNPLSIVVELNRGIVRAEIVDVALYPMFVVMTVCATLAAGLYRRVSRRLEEFL